MTHPSGAPHPRLLIVPSPSALGDGVMLIVREAKGPAEERLLGTRAVLVARAGMRREAILAAANAALDEFDLDASASPPERARRALVAVRDALGDTAQAAMLGVRQDEGWAARWNSTGAAALLGTKHARGVTVSAITIPDDAPGVAAASLTRLEVRAARFRITPGDRLALAVDGAGAKRALRRKVELGANGEPQVLDSATLVVELVGAVVATRRANAPTHDTLLPIPSDPIAGAAALARARWEETNSERAGRIAAATPPKITTEAAPRAAGTMPYEPIDSAARTVLEARRAVARGEAPVRGRGNVTPAGRDERLEAATRASREAARTKAKARAERERGVEPVIERSWIERSAASSSPLRRAVATVAHRATLYVEAKFPWLSPPPAAATLRTSPERGTPTVQDAALSGRRRAATALLVAIVIAGVGGAGALYLSRTSPELDAAARGRAAMASATQAVDEALDPQTNLVVNDPERAQKLLTEALTGLVTAEAGGVNATSIAALRVRAAATLNTLLLVNSITATTLFDFAAAKASVTLASITAGPDGLPYVVDSQTGAVYRVDPQKGRATVIYQPGFDLFGTRTGKALIITSAGPDTLIFDASSNLWRWRPADSAGRGTLVKLRVRDGATWGTDIRAIVGFAADPGTGLYRLYVVDPSARQILRYQPAADGTGYPSSPTGFLTSPISSLGSVDSIVIDGDMYLAQAGTIRRYVAGVQDNWAPADPGDSVLRPTPNYTLITSLGDARTGSLFAWDSAAHRVIQFSKGPSGAMIAQYLLSDQHGPVTGVIGGYLAPANDGGAPSFVWATATGIYSAVLGVQVEPGPGTSANPTPVPIIEVPTPSP